MRDLLSKGVIPQMHDAQQAREKGEQRKQSEALKKERSAVKEGRLEDRTTAASDENFDTERDFVIAGQAVGGMHDVRPTATKPHAKSKPAAELVANTV